MPIKGLTEKEDKIVKDILKLYLGKYDFYFYGPRVKGNFRPLSDLDILVVFHSLFYPPKLIIVIGHKYNIYFKYIITFW